MYLKNALPKEKILLALAIFLTCLQIFISMPFSIWAENQFNFGINLSSSTVIFRDFAFSLAIISFIISSVIPIKYNRTLLVGFCILAIALYIQQNILVWNYGLITGMVLDFSINNHLGYIDSLLWLGATTSFFLNKRHVYKHASTILLFVTLVAGANFGFTLFNYESTNAQAIAKPTEENKFVFSQRKNILFFLLDGFQTDLFWDIIDKSPDLRNDLQGFTYYPNTTAVFSKTYPTIPLLLTGKTYRKQEPIKTFLENVYDESLLTELVNNHWDVGIFPYVNGVINLSSKIATNIRYSITNTEIAENYLNALNFSIYRSVPHILKPLVYNKGHFIFGKKSTDYLKARYTPMGYDLNKKIRKNTNYKHHAKIFLSGLTNYSGTQNDKQTFRFFHINAPHEPFTLNIDLEYGRIGDDFYAYREYAEAINKLMTAYLQQIKNLGIYDNSMIIIAADHGGGEYTEKRYNPKKKEFEDDAKYGHKSAAGRPLLLIKPFGAQGVMQQSEKPLSLLDIAPTIAKAAGLNSHVYEGLPIDLIDSNEKRKRIFHFYNFTGWKLKYLEDFETYEIDGHVFDDSSWSYIGKLKHGSTTNNNKNLIPEVSN